MEKKGRKVELTRCKGLVPMLLLGSLGLSTAATYLQDTVVSESAEDTNFRSEIDAYETYRSTHSSCDSDRQVERIGAPVTD